MIAEKKEELIRMIRMYLQGFVDVKAVRNTLNCLFVDIMLDERECQEAKGLYTCKGRDNFEQFMKEMK